MSQYKKPLPQPNPDTKPFWDGCRQHKLLMQRCTECKTLRFFPRPMCHACNSMNGEWVEVSGKGKIYCWIVPTHNVHPGFVDEGPYVVVVVQLDDQEDLRVIGNIVDCRPEDLNLGMPVEVVFDDVTEEVTLPKWRPTGS